MSPRPHETDPVKAVIKQVRGYMLLGAIAIGAVEGGFKAIGIFDAPTSATAAGSTRIWDELRTIDDTLNGLRTDMKVLQEAEKQNIRRDAELTAIEVRLGSVEIQEARLEAKIPRS